MGQNFHKIEAVRLEGGDPPQSGQPDRFFSRFFFDYFPKYKLVILVNLVNILLILQNVVTLVNPVDLVIMAKLMILAKLESLIIWRN